MPQSSPKKPPLSSSWHCDTVLSDAALPPWDSIDRRNSSTQSLVPSVTVTESRRTLLLIYAHGFMGDESSFQSFPAHVHNLVKMQLAETHVVHTKIYPRYKSRKAIQIATYDFSTWLTPHESPNTDIIILGHSMGGILAAEVELLSPHESATTAFRHVLLGTINFDVPFLGVHPGIIKSGLSSLFRPAVPTANVSLEFPSLSQESASTASLSTTTSSSTYATSVESILFDSQPIDPNYNPPYENDVRLPVRKGWRNVWHFINKHSNDLAKASQNWLTSHYEFGSVLADYKGLKARYCKIRILEEDDQETRQSIISSPGSAPRVRFVNYYTASTGRAKKSKTSRPSNPEEIISEGGSSSQGLRASSLPSTCTSSQSPRLSLEEYQNDGDIPEMPFDFSQNSSKSEQVYKADQGDLDVALCDTTSEPFDPPRSSDAVATVADNQNSQPLKKKSERTFCILPPKDEAGNRDHAWIRLLMEGVDEVEAHTSLFFMGDAYAKLVGDVAERIEHWVKDEMTQRMIRGCAEE